MKVLINDSHRDLSAKIDKLEEQSTQFQFKALESLEQIEHQELMQQNSERILSGLRDHLETLNAVSKHDIREMKSEITSSIRDDMNQIIAHVNALENYIKSKLQVALIVLILELFDQMEEVKKARLLRYSSKLV